MSIKYMLSEYTGIKSDTKIINKRQQKVNKLAIDVNYKRVRICKKEVNDT